MNFYITPMLVIGIGYFAEEEPYYVNHCIILPFFMITITIPQ
jgi:hypothetical protein